MALIRCCACERTVPDRVEFCPYCGAEPVKVRSLLTIVTVAAVGLVLGVLGAALWSAIRRASSAGPRTQYGRAAVRSMLGTVGGRRRGGPILGVFPPTSR